MSSPWLNYAFPSFVVGAALTVATVLCLRALGFKRGTLNRPGTYNGPCQFIQLSQGRVRYRLFTPPSTSTRQSPSLPLSRLPLLVMCHGLGFPSEMLAECAEKVCYDSKFRVLIFDLYGRGWSSAPDVPYSPELFVGQIAELLFALNETEPVTLFGNSMGGAIVTHFAATYPHKVAQLILCASAGLPMPPAATAGRRALLIPLMGDVIAKFALPSLSIAGAGQFWQSSSSSTIVTHWKQFVTQYIREHPGFIRSLHSTIKHFPLDSIEPAFYQRFAVTHPQLPILLIWGSNDELIPVTNGREMRRLFNGEYDGDGASGRVTLVEVAGANHNMITERANDVAEIVAPWIRKHCKEQIDKGQRSSSH